MFILDFKILQLTFSSANSFLLFIYQLAFFTLPLSDLSTKHYPNSTLQYGITNSPP
jgi:hypothetical protein